MAYETTEVPVSRSQEHIRTLLMEHGAQQFTFGEGQLLDGRRYASVEFIHNGYLVRFRATQRDVTGEVNKRVRNPRTRKSRERIEQEAHGQEERRIWRVLYHSIKARMVAVEEGLESFQQAFLAHLVDPASGQTLWDMLEPRMDVMEIGGRGLRSLEGRVG